MLPINKILLKVLVAKFYERNAGMFLFIFFLMFGIVESTQIVSYHKSLMYATLTSPIFLICVSVVWTLYLLKCIQFISSQLDLPENNFLFQLTRLNWHQQYVSISFNVFLIYEPVLIYSLFIVGLGFYTKIYLTSSLIILFHIAGIAIASAIIAFKLNSTHRSFNFVALPSLKWRWPKPFPLFYISHLTTQLPSVLFFTKAFAILSMYGFLQMPIDHYEIRIAQMALLFALAAHAVIIFEFRNFEERFLSFTISLPISISKRFILLAYIYFLLLLPECIMLLANNYALQDVIGTYTLGVGILIFLHCSLYTELNNEKHLEWVLGLFLISFMLVLFKMYLVELILVWSLAYYRYSKNYFHFEFKS